MPGCFTKQVLFRRLSDATGDIHPDVQPAILEDCRLEIHSERTDSSTRTITQAVKRSLVGRFASLATSSFHVVVLIYTR